VWWRRPARDRAGSRPGPGAAEVALPGGGRGGIAKQWGGGGAALSRDHTPHPDRILRCDPTSPYGRGGSNLRRGHSYKCRPGRRPRTRRKWKFGGALTRAERKHGMNLHTLAGDADRALTAREDGP